MSENFSDNSIIVEVGNGQAASYSVVRVTQLTSWARCDATAAEDSKIQ